MPETPTPPPDELAARRKRRPATKKDGTPRARPGTKKGRKENSPAGSTTGAKAITAAARQAKAINLRLAGASLTVVAKECGYADPSGAQKAITAGIREMLPEQTRDEARRMEIARLDRLEMNAWPRAMAGDEKAEATILRCIGMRAKLLGLEAPAILDVRVREGEMVRVEVLDVLLDADESAIRELVERVSEQSEMRAGAIDVEPTSVTQR